MSHRTPQSTQHETLFQVVTVIPPPPPPPPPKPPEQKMIEQPKMLTPERQPPQHVDASKPNAAAKPAGIDSSPGPGGAGLDLAGTPGGTGLGDGGGSRWGWYATIVQEQVSQALRDNAKTRNSRFKTEVRLWSDAAGRIERVQLVTSTGDPNIDATLTREVLQGLQLRQPPPTDMPMPIVMRVTGNTMQ